MAATICSLLLKNVAWFCPIYKDFDVNNTMNVGCIRQVLAHLLDMVFYSDEKEKVIPLLVNIMHYVVPYLRNHRCG